MEAGGGRLNVFAHSFPDCSLSDLIVAGSGNASARPSLKKLEWAKIMAVPKAGWSLAAAPGDEGSFVAVAIEAAAGKLLK